MGVLIGEPTLLGRSKMGRTVGISLGGLILLLVIVAIIF
jgi:hypothetical protein